MTTQFKELIDLQGKTIITYILYEIEQKFRELEVGNLVEILTEPDVALMNDIKAWCRTTGHELIDELHQAEFARYTIRKMDVNAIATKSYVLVLSNDGLEELLAPLGLMLGAALAGQQVSIYFQGPAVRILAHGFKERLGGINRPFSSIARNELAEIGHVPPQIKLQQLAELGAQFVACGPSMENFKVSPTDFMFDNIIIGEYLTLVELMNQADIHLFVQ